MVEYVKPYRSRTESREVPRKSAILRLGRSYLKSGFSLIELVVVIAILGMLVSLAMITAKPLIIDARQAAASTYVEAVLKSANVHLHSKGALPSSWAEIMNFSGSSGVLAGVSLASCAQFNSQCNGNERVIVNGNYLITFFVRPGQFAVSAWRFSNDGSTAENRSVMGCLSESGGQRMYAWKQPFYFQGAAWRSGITDESGVQLNLCG